MRLALCTACRRQLNVSGLAPGVELRCVCGAEVRVGHPRELTVEGLACGHCGAPVGRRDERCGHCSAGLSERDRVESLLCPGCLTRLPEDSRHCKACGIGLRPQAITALRAEAHCPACRGALQVRLCDDFDVVECGGCHGVWVPDATLKVLSARAASGQLALLAAPTPVSEHSVPEELARDRGYVPCVTCGQLMHRRQYRHAGRASGVVVDHCKDHGAWFDAGELAAILRFVAEAPFADGPKQVPGASAERTRDGGPVSLPEAPGRGARRRAGPAAEAFETLLDFLSGVLYWNFLD